MPARRIWPQVIFWSSYAGWAIGLALCMEPALFGEQRWTFAGIGGLLAGPLANHWARRRENQALSTPQQAQVDAAVRTGVPTGVARVDVVARNRLNQMVQACSRGMQALGYVGTLLTAAVPVAAAVRMHEPLYLLALPTAVPPLLVALKRRARGPRLAQRLARFDNARGGTTQPST